MSAREEWRASPLPAIIVPNAIGPELAAVARTDAERANYTRYPLVDRASYAFVEPSPLTALHEALLGFAREITGRALVVSEARVIRLEPGDYLLVRHDRVLEHRPVELVLDLSPSPVPGAEVHYRHRGQVFFTVPSMPGTMALVERGPTILANHTYVSKRHSGACVVRLVMRLDEQHG